MQIPKPHFLLMVIAVSAFGRLPVYASSRELTAEGNRAYAAGKYDQALAAYREALVEMPESAQLFFNQGTAYYMKQDYAKAREKFEAAALKTKDLSLEARSQYNLGNCAFRESERQRDSDLRKSLKALEEAVRHYQQALQLDPELKAAAHNIEIARLTIKQILDEIKKQEEAQKQRQQQQQKQQDKLKRLIQKQEELAQESKALNDKKQQGEGSEEQRQKAEELAKAQQKLKDETKDLAQKMKPRPEAQGQPKPAGEKARQHLQDAVAKQEKAEQELQQQNFSPARSAQEKAAEEMKQALQEMKRGQGGSPQGQKNKPGKKGKQPQPSPSQEPQGGQPQQPQQQPPQKPEARKPVAIRDEDAHNIINEERENKDRRQLSIPGGYQPVDKDW